MKVLISDATKNMGQVLAYTLHKNGFEIHGYDGRILPFGIKSKYLKNSALITSDSAEEHFSKVLALIKRLKPDVFIPIYDTHLLISHRAVLRKYTNVWIPSVDSFHQTYSNVNTLALCNKLNIPCPRSFLYEEARSILTNNQLSNQTIQFVIKPDSNLGGAKGVRYVNDIQSLEKLYMKGKENYKSLTIQEYIPGSPNDMYTLNLLYDHHTTLLVSFATKKIRQYPYTGGNTVVAININGERLLNLIHPIFKQLKWVGPVEVEFKLDQRDQEFKVIEINPRFTGILPMIIQSGVNIPLIMCLAISGNSNDESKLPGYTVNQKWIHSYVNYFRSVFQEFRLKKQVLPLIKSIFMELKGISWFFGPYTQDYLFRISKYYVEIKNTITRRN